jgi:hypothetical protein
MVLPEEITVRASSTARAATTVTRNFRLLPGARRQARCLLQVPAVEPIQPCSRIGSSPKASPWKTATAYPMPSTCADGCPTPSRATATATGRRAGPVAERQGIQRAHPGAPHCRPLYTGHRPNRSESVASRSARSGCRYASGPRRSRQDAVVNVVGETRLPPNSRLSNDSGAGRSGCREMARAQLGEACGRRNRAKTNRCRAQPGHYSRRSAG